MLARTQLVTIIMTTYNHVRLIAEALRSVQAQTYPNWELIVVDDGSTDGTSEIVKGFCEQDTRIQLVKRSHQGIGAISKAYNLALARAKGEFIAILEADDFWPVDKLEKQLISFLDPQVVLSWGIGALVNQHGKVVGKTRPPNMLCISGKQAFRALLFRNFLVPTVTVMVRKNALLEHGFVQPKGCPFTDYPTWFTLTDKGKWCFLNEVLGYWRIHPGQMTRKLGIMWKGEVATYKMLWRQRRINFTTLAFFTAFSVAKLLRRAVIWSIFWRFIDLHSSKVALSLQSGSAKTSPQQGGF